MNAEHSASKNRVVGLMYRQAVLYWRHIDRKFEIAFWPIVDALMFGSIGVYAAKQGSSTGVAYLLAGFVMAQVVWHSHIHVSKAYLQEMYDKNVLYVLTRPYASKELLASITGLSLIVTVIAAAFISVVTALLFGLNLLVVPIGFVVLFPILVMLGWSTGLLATALVTRLGHKADNFVWAMYGLIAPLSGFVVPVENMPFGLRHLAALLPTTHAYAAGRQMLFGTEFPVTSLALAGIGAITTLGLSIYAVHRSMQVFRQRGLISGFV